MANYVAHIAVFAFLCLFIKFVIYYKRELSHIVFLWFTAVSVIAIKNILEGLGLEKVTDYFIEQTQRNITKLFDLAKESVTNSVDLLSWAQKEAQQLTSQLTQQGTEQYIAQLEKLRTQQLEAQNAIRDQFESILNILQPKGENSNSAN